MGDVRTVAPNSLRQFDMQKAYLLSLVFAATLIAATMPRAQNLDNPAFTAFTQGDYANALRLTEAGIAQGDADAFWLLGLMYASGTGVQRDNRLAIKYLTDGVDAGATYGLTLMGNIYQEGGHGVDQDVFMAAQLYKRGADEGYADAQWLLGELYLNSEVVGISPVKAAASFSKAALQEHPEALYSLATLYQTGHGVEKNPAGAADLFTLAAIAGNSAAALRLAEMLEKADGVPANAEEAAFYFVVAAELGNAEARASAAAAKKAMNFRPVRQIAFENRIEAWFSEHGHNRTPWDNP
ncbi:MAG: hypothetical protein GKS03_17365 [Alphaproteobacteria bacterium]|nr:hypothetical protein [Alphaproteobacteria bacterium]